MQNRILQGVFGFLYISNWLSVIMQKIPLCSFLDRRKFSVLLQSRQKEKIPDGRKRKMVRNTYGNLLKPAAIGKMQLKNRICMAPMDFKYFSWNEDVSSLSYRHVKVFEARAKGGCGIISGCILWKCRTMS